MRDIVTDLRRVAKRRDVEKPGRFFRSARNDRSARCIWSSVGVPVIVTEPVDAPPESPEFVNGVAELATSANRQPQAAFGQPGRGKEMVEAAR